MQRREGGKRNGAICKANYEPLTPISFLLRTQSVFPERVAVIHGERSFTYEEFGQRVRRLASALKRRGIQQGDTVSIIAPNIPAHIEAHFAVPMIGATLNSINTRLDPATVAYILKHGESRLLLADTEYLSVAREAMDTTGMGIPLVEIGDPAYIAEGTEEREYGLLLAEGDPGFVPGSIDDEMQPIALNYTSGTTGEPKGVIYSHRGAYLNALGGILAWQMPMHPVYLWTLPMFHCNGWCFPWSVVAQAGTQVCLRGVRADDIVATLDALPVTHLCGAPVILGLLTDLVDDLDADGLAGLNIMTAGAAPAPAIIRAIEAAGADVTHVYGLTEVYGPASVCVWKPEWSALPPEQQVKLKARQGVAYPTMETMDVLDPVSMTPVPANGETIGEVMFRGNTVMAEYFNNAAATEEAFQGGWFRSGDLAVKHPDGYVEIKDRLKDIIISGGENISSVEVEAALHEHADVQSVAVVVRPDEKWGETPCAFVQLRPGATVSEAELIDFCRDRLASFKLPRSVIFGEVPTTSTGKVQKYILRERASSL
ncbi:MAG: AMP-binding protein [Haliea sp.]